MADIKSTKSVYVSERIQRGSLVYVEPRKGIRAKLARFLYRWFSWERLHVWGYEAKASRVDTPIGVAIDSKTILIGGTVRKGD